MTQKDHAQNSALVWLRRDFRLADHAPLAEATRHHDRVYLAFVLDPQVLKEFAPGLKPHASFFGALVRLHETLQARGSGVILLEGNPIEQIPTLCQELGVSTVYAGRDYELTSRARDSAVGSRLHALGRKLILLKDQVLWEENEILTQTEQPYRVFTPYKRASLSRTLRDLPGEFSPQLSRLAPPVARPDARKQWSRLKEQVDQGIQESGNNIFPGFEHAEKRLEEFCERAVRQYSTGRNLPALPGTSLLSQDLRNGSLSPRQIWRRIQSLPDVRPQEKEAYLSELIWRDFFHMIAFQFPHVFERNYNAKYDRLEWRNDPEEFERWCHGKTGYPIVDAGMRELVNTGFMHNRVRMITAMFLTKDLLVDWRWGERFFRQHLIDGDLAVNNGNWQWCASTGVDAQPYFRIFNPIVQSKKFDPEGAYLRRHLPELSGLPSSILHWPGEKYLAPVVDHAAARLRCLSAFQVAAQADT